MSSERKSAWARLRGTVRSRILAGLLVLVPLGITFLVLRFLFRTAAGVLDPVIAPLLDPLPAAVVAIASVVALVLLTYLVGLLAAMFVGRRLLALGEGILVRIPLVKTIYTASKQVVETLSLPNRGTFKAVVFVEFPRPGFKAVGFVTGRFHDAAGKEYAKIFIPTAPNPTSGFLELVPAEDVQEASMSVEEAIKMILSGGILSPDSLASPPPEQPAPSQDAAGADS